MTKRRLEEVFLILLTVKAVVVSTQGDQRDRNSLKEKPDHRGKTFLLGFLEMDGLSPTSNIFLASRMRAKVVVSFLGKNITRTVVPAISTKIHLPNGVRMAGFGKEKKGILITSNVSISVYATNARWQSRDVHVVFPSSTLGTEHVAVTFTPRKKALIGIVAMHDDTLVQMRLRFRTPGSVSYDGNTYRGGDVLRVFLNRLETFQAQHGQDLTGTEVISSKPVAVLSGNICASVPNWTDTCSHLALQVPSVSKWGTRFITTPVPDRTIFPEIFRIVAAYNDTLITVEGKENFSLHAGGFRQIKLLGTENRYITSSKPSIVVQFNNANLEYVYSDSFTLLVPPIEQYGYDYDLVIPVQKQDTKAIYLTFISIVIETARTHTLLFNTSLLEYGKFKWKSIKGTQYSTTASGFSTTPYSKAMSIMGNSSDVRFAVFAVGHTDTDGYGYLGGMTMADINCNRLFAAGVGSTGEDCVGKWEQKLGYVVSNCNSSYVSVPGSVYLNGAHFNDSITTGDSCEKVINRTWYVRSPNGSRITFATQRIRWQKPSINVTFPADARVDHLNSSALGHLVNSNISSLCPLDDIDITYVDSVGSIDDITRIRRQWIVREDCGRTVTGNQTILIGNSIPTVNTATTEKNKGKSQERQGSLGVLLGLSIGFLAMGLLVISIVIARIWKLHKSRRITITARVDVLRTENELSHYTNTVAIAESKVYSEIKIESFSEDEK